MTQKLNRILDSTWQRQPLLLGWLCVQMILVLFCFVPARAQGLGISGANVEGACPAACGVRVDIKDVKLRERADGIDAVIDWDVSQSAPEIKLRNFNVTITVEFNRLGKDERTVSAPPGQRQAVIRLQSGGFNKDIKFSDVTSVRAQVAAIADPLPPLNITDLPSVKIVGQGGDSAVDVSWRPPTPLACSADRFFVRVKAINEKGDRLNGDGTAAITARSLRVQLKGDLNKKGLRNPEATVELNHSLIVCQKVESFPPKQEGFGSGTGSNVPNPVVTLKPVQFSEGGGRVDMFAFWDVVEPQGFKATKFDVVFEVANANGAISSVPPRTVSGNERTVRGPQAQIGDFRSVTVTITATFTNTGNTAILTRTDKRTQAFTSKSTLPKAEPVTPQAQSVGLSVAGVKINTQKGLHAVTVAWVVKPPTGVTITSFQVDATALGNQRTATRSAVVSGQTALTLINFTFDDIGAEIKKVQAKIIANARRSDGSTFQQSVIGEGQAALPTTPPPPPPVQLKVTNLIANNSGNNFIINGAWFIEVQAGITVQNFIVEATLLKPTGPVRKTATVNAPVRQQSFTFTAAEANGATAVEMKVTANLRRADGTTFQETSTRPGTVSN